MYRHMTDPAHHPILVADIEDSSGRPAYVRARLQRDTHDILAAALAESGVLPDECSISERGDGALVVLRSDASKSRLTDTCLRTVPALLKRIASQHNDFGRLRLRIGLNAGDITRTAEGSWLGDPVDTAFRLADAQATKDALAAAKDADMVLVLSGIWFDDVVRPGLGIAHETDFAALTIRTHGKDFPAWLALPGVPRPAEYVAQSVTVGKSSSAAASPADAPAASDHSAVVGQLTIDAGGIHVFGGDQVGRDKTVNNHYGPPAGPR